MENIFNNEGRIDILVNNAGVDSIRSATGLTLEEWDRVQHVNLRAPWLLSGYLSAHGRAGIGTDRQRLLDGLEKGLGERRRLRRLQARCDGTAPGLAR